MSLGFTGTWKTQPQLHQSKEKIGRQDKNTLSTTKNYTIPTKPSGSKTARLEDPNTAEAEESDLKK